MVNTNELTLKPCPFCGGEAILVKDFSSFKDWTYVRCKECGASVAVVDNPYRAIENWNKRYEDKLLERILEENPHAFDRVNAISPESLKEAIRLKKPDFTNHDGSHDYD